jgi:FtsZ-binding cell division protein ZapB
MKKAFEQNVSRAKPRLRLGGLTGLLEPGTEQQAPEAAAQPPEPSTSEPTAPATPDLSAEVRARIERARAPRPTAAEAMGAALRAPPEPTSAAVSALRSQEPTLHAPASAEPGLPPQDEPDYGDEDDDMVTSWQAPPSPRGAVQASAPVARTEAPPTEVEVQTPPSPHEEAIESEARRHRLKERLKAVRENPRPEPLPASVAEAGQRAVERITTLQAELTRVKALNLSLTQELEVTRRQAEKATEEARLRMDEARRLATEMEGRVSLLGDLERELAALEGERDEALLSLQEYRQALEAASRERETLETEVAQGKQALTDSLAEEERLAGELEQAKDESAGLRRAVETLQGERDVLAQQVASLTAERAELLEARKALEAVHRALSQASVR